ISLYGLTADPTTIEQQVGGFASVLPAEAYNLVIVQVHRLAEASGELLGWSFVVSLALSIWSVMSLTHAMFSALYNGYYRTRVPRPADLLSERFHIRIVGDSRRRHRTARHRLCADPVCLCGIVATIRIHRQGGALAFARALGARSSRAALPLRPMPPCHEVAVG